MDNDALKTVFLKALTETHTTDIEGLGSIRFDRFGNKYRYVKNTGTPTLLVSALAYLVEDSTLASQGEVEECLAAGLGFLAGLVMATAGLATDEYGWIQVAGRGSALALGLTDATWTLGATMKGVDQLNTCIQDQALGTAAIYPRTLVLLESIATVQTPAAAAVDVMIIGCG